MSQWLELHKAGGRPNQLVPRVVFSWMFQHFDLLWSWVRKARVKGNGRVLQERKSTFWKWAIRKCKNTFNTFKNTKFCTSESVAWEADDRNVSRVEGPSILYTCFRLIAHTHTRTFPNTDMPDSRRTTFTGQIYVSDGVMSCDATECVCRSTTCWRSRSLRVVCVRLPVEPWLKARSWCLNETSLAARLKDLRFHVTDLKVLTKLSLQNTRAT